jgi:hypothetical protein
MALGAAAPDWLARSTRWAFPSIRATFSANVSCLTPKQNQTKENEKSNGSCYTLKRKSPFFFFFFFLRTCCCFRSLNWLSLSAESCIISFCGERHTTGRTQMTFWIANRTGKFDLVPAGVWEPPIDCLFQPDFVAAQSTDRRKWVGKKFTCKFRVKGFSRK